MYIKHAPLQPRLAAASLAAFICIGCGGDGNVMQPVARLDPVAAAATADSASQLFFDDNEALTALVILGRFIIVVTAQPDIAPYNHITSLPGGRAPGLAGSIRAGIMERESVSVLPGGATGARAGAGAGAGAGVPEELRGTTWAWNPSTGGYEVDSGALGAPTDGARFRLYEVDTSTRQPLQPLTDIGHIDIIDSSPPGSIAISLEAVVDGVTLIAYDVTGLFDAASFDYTASGFLADGSEQSNFSFSNSSSRAGQSAISLIDFGSALIRFESSFDPRAIVFTTVATFTETSSGDMIVITLLQNSNSEVLDGSGVAINDAIVATITGGVGQGQISNVEGSPLDADQLRSLTDLFSAADQLGFRLFDLSNFAITLLN